MKVAVVAAGRYWAGELARALHRRGCLAGLYTADPRPQPGIPQALVHRFPWAHLPLWWAQRRGFAGLARLAAWPAAVAFDRWASRSLASADAVVALAGFGLHTLRAARRRYRALTVCDRGSTHILAQAERLHAAAARYALPYRGPTHGLIRRELAEYDEADLITVPSRGAWRSFRCRGVPEHRLARVPFGVDLARFSPDPAVPRPGHSSDPFRVLYVGQMSIRKGLPDLLAALAPHHGRDLDLALVGGMLPEVRPVFHHYRGQYRWLGHHPEHRLVEQYRQASVVVLASVEEGLARVLLQALACGVPLVATDATGAPDIISDEVEGFIVPAGQPAALRERVLRLHRDPQLRGQMAQAARRRAQALGDWDAYGSRAHAAYRAARNQRCVPLDQRLL